jgi:hypothetical protein
VTYRTMTLSITTLYHYAECRILFIVMLIVVLMNAVMLSVAIMNVVMLSATIMNVIMLSVAIMDVVILSVAIMNVVMLSVTIMNVVMLSVAIMKVVMLSVALMDVAMLSVAEPLKFGRKYRSLPLSRLPRPESVYWAEFSTLRSQAFFVLSVSAWHRQANPNLELKTRPRFRRASLSLSMA